MTPEARERVRDQLKIDEGVVYEVYLDHLGLPTCGIGHLVVEGDLEHGEPVGFPVGEDRVNTLFNIDFQTMIKECEALYEDNWNTYPEEVQEVLVNMMFNMGRSRMAGFKNFRKALDEGDWKTSAVEGRDSRWYDQVGARAERLMSRLEKV